MPLLCFAPTLSACLSQRRRRPPRLPFSRVTSQEGQSDYETDYEEGQAAAAAAAKDKEQPGDTVQFLL